MNIGRKIVDLKHELPSGVELVAVSKTHPVEAIVEAYEAGQRIFGENRPQEMKSKWEQLPSDIEWHLIGQLQSNKVRMVAPFVAMIHSVDSEKLLSVIDKEAERVGRTIKVLMEVRIAQEETKHGWAESDLREYAASGRWRELRNVEICGLMSVATNTDDESVIESEYERLHCLFSDLQPIFGDSFTELSIGMSDDYRLAIKHGSTMVRIGSSIFGYRSYNIK